MSAGAESALENIPAKDILYTTPHGKLTSNNASYEPPGVHHHFTFNPTRGFHSLFGCKMRAPGTKSVLLLFLFFFCAADVTLVFNLNGGRNFYRLLFNFFFLGILGFSKTSGIVTLWSDTLYFSRKTKKSIYQYCKRD